MARIKIGLVGFDAPQATASKAKRSSGRWTLAALSLSAMALIAGVLPSQARAADGCMVLLCLAAPSWSNVVQCVDPVRQTLNDVARGRPFPSCSTAGSGSNIANEWASAPSLCPPQYTHATELESSTVFTCDYDAVVSVTVDSAPWSRTWWRMAGGATVTEFSSVAKAQLGTWDTQFDDDYARWFASIPVPTRDCPSC